jgi:hypothetical protein
MTYTQEELDAAVAAAEQRGYDRATERMVGTEKGEMYEQGQRDERERRQSELTEIVEEMVRFSGGTREPDWIDRRLRDWATRIKGDSDAASAQSE